MNNGYPNWTEENVKEYMFQEMEFSFCGEKWFKEIFIGYNSLSDHKFLSNKDDWYRFMRPIKVNEMIMIPVEKLADKWIKIGFQWCKVLEIETKLQVVYIGRVKVAWSVYDLFNSELVDGWAEYPSGELKSFHEQGE